MRFKDKVQGQRIKNRCNLKTWTFGNERHIKIAKRIPYCPPPGMTQNAPFIVPRWRV